METFRSIAQWSARLPACFFGLVLCATAAIPGWAAPPAVKAVPTVDSWEVLDSRIRNQVFQVNVAIHIKLKDKQYAQLVDISSRQHYPVFATTSDDKGYRVVGYGSCFPVQTNRHDATYFLTNKHVVDFGDGMIAEAARFFAAMRLHAERTAGLSSPEQRYKDLIHVVNLGLKKNLSGAEKAVYQNTVDSIWDTYDHHLAIKVDPRREQFKKYLTATAFEGEVGYFIHGPGSSQRPPIVGQLYRKAVSDMDPDLALIVARVQIPALELDPHPPAPGQVVQAIGYPAIKQSGVIVPPVYEPTFTTGKVKSTVASLVQFDAPVSNGDSGGPLINQQGRVVGVVVRRALNGIFAPFKPKDKSDVDDFAGAVSVASVRAFAPELFGASVSLKLKPTAVKR